MAWETNSARPLAALMIAPDRALAERFSAALAAARAFQILGELKIYPPRQMLDIRLRQLQPEVVLLDLATDFRQAGELIGFIAKTHPGIHVVGLHEHGDSDVILRALRLGATEFLHAPFDAATQEQAAGRIRRLTGVSAPREAGKIVLFASAKPGSGASTLATHTAFALARITGKKVLLADMDVMGRTVRCSLKLGAAEPGGRLSTGGLGGVSGAGAFEEPATGFFERDETGWPAIASAPGGLDIAAVPEAPQPDSPAPARLHDFIERARQNYAWTVLDLPAIFHRLSLLALSESDRAFLVSTAELPSLHLARKAVNLLLRLGFEKDRFQLLINRVDRHDGLRHSDVAKVVNCAVDIGFPNDYASLERALARGAPLGADCELGRHIEALAARLAGEPALGKSKTAAPP
ncbi:MAG: hypothetical protein ABSG25_15600, partial [Bryobacteraceae bacterium]